MTNIGVKMSIASIVSIIFTQVAPFAWREGQLGIILIPMVSRLLAPVCILGKAAR